MFRKEPAVIKSWEEHGNAFYVSLQKQITKACLSMLKPGGYLVYSTCTFAPCEDEDMILYMKKLCPELTVCDIPGRYEGFSEGFPEQAAEADPDLQKCIRIFPHQTDGEGHFVTLLKKGEATETEETTSIKGHSKRADISLPDEVREFLAEIRMSFESGAFEVKNDKLYWTPEISVPLQGLRVMRQGLLIGELKKNRFEPSQALAMALKEEEFSQTVNFTADDDRVIRYLKGETLDISDKAHDLKGYVLVCVDHFPLGFGKAAGGVLKNKYLPGWRYQ